jgi:ribosomal-protein-alanine N-acetyltransferase
MQNNNVDKDKIIFETERLYVRQFIFSDFANFYKLHSSKDAMQFFMSGQKSMSEAIAVFSYIQNHQKKYGYSYWAVFKKDTDEFIGQAGVTYTEKQDLNLCFAFLKEFWGKGYATETINAVIKWVFENTSENHITAMAMPHNTKSRKLMEKIGMKYIDDWKLENGTMASHYIIKKADFLNSKK